MTQVKQQLSNDDYQVGSNFWAGTNGFYSVMLRRVAEDTVMQPIGPLMPAGKAQAIADWLDRGGLAELFRRAGRIRYKLDADGEALAALVFMNPVFNLGPNLTVRAGVKWNKFDGKLVRLFGSHGKAFGDVRLTTYTRKFRELTDDELKYEHDESCRTVDGLREQMKKIYLGPPLPGPKFHEENLVTLVRFDLYESLRGG